VLSNEILEFYEDERAYIAASGLTGKKGGRKGSISIPDVKVTSGTPMATTSQWKKPMAKAKAK